MNGILIIAQMTFLEARRNRIIWSLVFFCLLLVLTSFEFQELTIASFDRIVRDVGLGAINVFGVLLSVFLGVQAVTRDIERRSVYWLLAKPISRDQYLLGKLLGVWGTVAVCLLLMFLAFCIETQFYRGPFAPVIAAAFWLMLVEFLVLVSFSILVSAFSSSTMSAFMTLSLFAIGHLSGDLYFIGQHSRSATIREGSQVLFYLLPNLERLNLKGAASLLTPINGSQVLGATAYGLVYVAAFVTLAFALFRRRDLK